MSHEYPAPMVPSQLRFSPGGGGLTIVEPRFIDLCRDLDLQVHVWTIDDPDEMHHKVIIIDERILVTGSYNFSRSAEERNDENTLIIHRPGFAFSYALAGLHRFPQINCDQ